MKRLKLLAVFVALGINLLALGVALRSNVAVLAQERPQPAPVVKEAEQQILKADNGKAAPKDDQAPAPGTGLISPEAKPPPQTDASPEPSETAKPWDATVWATIATAAFTGVLAFVTIFQVCIYRRQADIMERQAELTEGGLKETRRSVDHAIRMERPWIVVTPPDSDPHEWLKIEGGSIPPTLQVWTATNIGRSPAFVTRMQIRMRIMDLPPPEGEPLYEVSSPFSKSLVPPNGTYKGQILVEIPQTEIEGILAEKKCVVFFGFIVYEDSSGQEHLTRFFSYWEHFRLGWHFSAVGPDGTIEYT